jgi:hypothetical protein
MFTVPTMNVPGWPDKDVKAYCTLCAEQSEAVSLAMTKQAKEFQAMHNELLAEAVSREKRELWEYVAKFMGYEKMPDDGSTFEDWYRDAVRLAEEVALRAAAVECDDHDCRQVHFPSHCHEADKRAILSLTKSGPLLDAHDAKVEHKGWVAALDSMEGAVRGYPDHGGHKPIMELIDRIRERQHRATLAKLESRAAEEYSRLMTDILTEMKSSPIPPLADDETGEVGS